jgi:hypothetical protein
MRVQSLVRTLIAIAVVAATASLAACTEASQSSSSGNATKPATHLALPNCPKTLATPAPKPSQSPAPSTGELVNFPPGYAVICRYSGLQQPGSQVPEGVLLGSATLRSATRLAYLRQELNSFKLLPAGAAIACPGDFGAKFNIYLGSPKATLQLQLGQTGCGFLVGPRGDYWHERTGDLSDELITLTTK